MNILVLSPILRVTAHHIDVGEAGIIVCLSAIAWAADITEAMMNFRVIVH